MEDFLDIELPEVDTYLREDDLWEVIRDLPQPSPRETDGESTSSLSLENACMDIPRKTGEDEDCPMETGEIPTSSGGKEVTVVKDEKIDISDFKNCTVMNITDHNARQKAIDFINAFPDTMKVNSITLELKFDKSPVKLESVDEVAKVKDTKAEIDNVPIPEAAVVKVGARSSSKKKRKTVTGHFICHICGEVYKHAANLSRHRTQKHKPTPATKCEACGKILKRPDYLKGHMKRCAKRY